MKLSQNFDAKSNNLLKLYQKCKLIKEQIGCPQGKAKKMKAQKEFDTIVINDDINIALNELKELMKI